jgi:hypothetical protein
MMTERKPQGMSFESWVDRQIREATERGVFKDLPGAGKPLNLKPGSGEDYGQAWIRDYARREGVQPEEFLPTPLRLRREVERLAEAVADMHSEEEVRRAVGDINRQIVEWRKMPLGPPVFVPLVNKDDMLARWREARRPPVGPATGAGPATPADPATPGQPAPPRRRRWRRWRRWRRRPSG